MVQILGLGLIGAFVTLAAVGLLAAMVWAIWECVKWAGQLRRSRLVKKELTAYEARKEIICADAISGADRTKPRREVMPSELRTTMHMQHHPRIEEGLSRASVTQAPGAIASGRGVLFPSAEDEAAYYRTQQITVRPRGARMNLDEFDRGADEHRAITARLLEKFDRRKTVR